MPFTRKAKVILFASATLVMGASYVQANNASNAMGMMTTPLNFPVQDLMNLADNPYAEQTVITAPVSKPAQTTSRRSRQAAQVAPEPTEKPNADQLLIQGLAGSASFDQVIRSQLGDGLSPEEIQRFKEAFIEYEMARNNPDPPPTRSDIRQLKAGETIDLVVMSDFPSTLMLADQFGEPLAISYHDLGAGSVVEIREMRNKKGEVDIVDGLRIHALSPMRSTSLTIRAEGSRLPINVTIRTIPADGKTSVAVLNELRLSWVSKISQTEVSAGRYAAPDITKRGDKLMMDVVTGVLLANAEEGIHKVQLEGAINSALFVDETSGFWYLRLPIDSTPQNVAIESQALSSINGYRVIRMKSAPPRVIGITANGRSYRLVMHLDRRLSHVQ